MSSIAQIKALVLKQREQEDDDSPIPGFTEDELTTFAEISEQSFPAPLEKFLRTPNIFIDGPELFIEDVGYFAFATPAAMIDAGQNLANSAEEYGWELPPCAVLSFVNNEFIAFDLETESVVSIDGDSGEVTSLETGLDGFLEQVAEEWAANDDE